MIRKALTNTFNWLYSLKSHDNKEQNLFNKISLPQGETLDARGETRTKNSSDESLRKKKNKRQGKGDTGSIKDDKRKGANKSNRIFGDVTESSEKIDLLNKFFRHVNERKNEIYVEDTESLFTDTEEMTVEKEKMPKKVVLIENKGRRNVDAKLKLAEKMREEKMSKASAVVEARRQKSKEIELRKMMELEDQKMLLGIYINTKAKRARKRADRQTKMRSDKEPRESIRMQYKNESESSNTLSNVTSFPVFSENIRLTQDPDERIQPVAKLQTGTSHQDFADEDPMKYNDNSLYRSYDSCLSEDSPIDD